MAEAKKVSLICQLPSLTKFDNSLNNLTACEHLALSTNIIDKMQPLPGLKNLKILSMGRNNLKRIEKLDEVSDTLEQLWLSYNQIERLDGLSNLHKLKILYLSNNNIKSLEELNKLRDLPALEEILLVGNPCYDGLTKSEQITEVIRRLPNLKKLDATIITSMHREEAEGIVQDGE
jgi:dynein light chain 1